jgi:lysophospholipase L1-like esterase
MSHVVLLGDSIFDNGVYVAPRPDVIRQLRARLGDGWSATLLAIDGDVVADVPRRQLYRVPADATHLVVSAGGNDALGQAGVLTERAQSVSEALDRLASAQEQFAERYRTMVEAVAGKGLPTAVCTIYDTNYPDPQRRLVTAALTLFNDVITREAFLRNLDVIDLRLICSERSDYANPIEPSAAGGEKIAAVIAAFVKESASPDRSQVWV